MDVMHSFFSTQSFKKSWINLNELHKVKKSWKGSSLTKGQIKSEWIYEIINFSVHFWMISYIQSDLIWPLKVPIFGTETSSTLAKSREDRHFMDKVGQKLTQDLKGQLNSEWIYEVIVSPKMPTKNYRFLPWEIRG